MSGIEIDLIQDFMDSRREELVDLGVSRKHLDEVEKNEDRSAIFIFYQRVLRRLIPVVPRKVRKSKEFSCPDNLSGALAKIEKDITSGEDLRCYLSDRIFRPNTRDDMLNELGVHHLHLGKQKADKLLFCHFTDRYAHFIGIYDHNSFLLPDVRETMYRNWPEIFRPLLLPGVKSLYPPLSEDQMRKIKLGSKRQGPWVTSLTPMKDGTFYMPYGGGVMTSGDATDDMRYVNHAMRLLTGMQEYILKSIEDGTVAMSNFEKPVRLRLYLVCLVPPFECVVVDENCMYSCRWDMVDDVYAGASPSSWCVSKEDTSQAAK